MFDFSLKKRAHKFFNRLLYWRLKHINQRNFLIIVSVLIGIPAAIAAVILKKFVHWLNSVAQYLISLPVPHILSILLPLIGIGLTVIITRIFFKGKLEKGLGNILYAISRKSAKLEKEKMYSHVLTSGITIGFGGSAGLEAPIVITGSAIGSNIASWFNLGYKERSLFLACGAAAGIAAVFNSPIAGVIFAMEVLLTEITIPAFIPILISAATSSILSRLLYKDQLFYLITTDWYFHAIPFYILLGIFCGLIAVYMTRMTLRIEGYFSSQKNIARKAVYGSLFLGLLIYIIPPLFGEGYNTIKDLLAGSYDTLVNYSFLDFLKNNPLVILGGAVVVIFTKVIASSVTIGAGGNGGIFAPSLFTGALTGFALAYGINLTELTQLSVPNFIVVGMAGILSGVVHAPLTAIFLIAEMTGGYVLFVPLMIVSALSYFISRYFEPYSIYTKKLALNKQLLTNDKDQNVLSVLKINDLIETDFIPLRAEGTLKSLVDAFTVSNRNIYPVIDNGGNLIGVILLEKVKSLLFKTDLFQKVTIEEITDKNVIPIENNESMESAMQKFEKTGQWNIPVINGTRYVGFISRSNIFPAYRRVLKQSSSLF